MLGALYVVDGQPGRRSPGWVLLSPLPTLGVGSLLAGDDVRRLEAVEMPPSRWVRYTHSQMCCLWVAARHARQASRSLSCVQVPYVTPGCERAVCCCLEVPAAAPLPVAPSASAGSPGSGAVRPWLWLTRRVSAPFRATVTDHGDGVDEPDLLKASCPLVTARPCGCRQSPPELPALCSLKTNSSTPKTDSSTSARQRSRTRRRCKSCGRGFVDE